MYYIAKFHGNIITKVENDGRCVHYTNRGNLKNTDSVLKFSSVEEARTELHYWWPEIKLVKLETLRRYIEAPFIITSDWPKPYVVKQTKKVIKTTCNAEMARRFATRAAAEKFMKTLHPSKLIKVNFAIAERSVL